MSKACIFDLDGTIGNTLDSMVYSVNLTLKQMGLSEISREQCQQFVGNGARVLMEKSLEASGDFGASRIEEGMRIYGRIFDANCTYHVTPCKGVPEMLHKLKEQGIRLGVLTNKPHLQAVKTVHAIYGEELFDWVQGQKDEIPRKPDPAGVFYVAKKLEVNPKECLYVGDSEVDVVTGMNAGMKTIAVTWGFRTKEELITAGAQYMIDQAEELPEYL